ncbi:uncharacterized protein C8Q71DRAFT_771562 [Rhodofomes roseus]|uniref:Uncharacterized protein n=1 Tax=Rhodofomes roseus TaxID=34475 RepID=A0A4Y9YPF3_9APHY|nr:uncharacterized protein C8Q71DRAFT_771562 [Rhodofomes roseus]KAH9834182.1 hypothetical protein C8Q71DRAFT_771562 [Rhodofomes roseus]TFY64324.1 hypothetical protein EVJ58_g2699 [Rhodofomes roseus]
MYSLPILVTAAAVLISVTSMPVRRDVDESLVPDFGVTAGIPDPAGSASCVNPAGVLIPCQCPPDRDSFIAELNQNVAAGKVLNNPSVAVTFPEDGSVQSQLARLQACTVTLQSLNGSGVGCPVAATNWANLQKQIASGGSTSGAGASTAAASATTGAVNIATSVATATGAAATGTTSTVDPTLVPDYGITANTNPTGTGDCDGVNGVKIPCFCPPNRDEFIGNLTANVAAGQVLTNPTVKLSFPLDASPQSALARLDACLVTLQNQRGSGVGCPAAATTWVALQKSLQSQIQ